MNDVDNVIKSILNKWNHDSSSLISILLDVQDIYNYLPEEALTLVAEKLNIPLIKVYSVATFYKVFSLTPRGKHIINICVGTACHVRGGRRLVERVEKVLDIGVGETTEDMQFTLETVRCLGACALGPVVVVDGEYHGQMSTKKMDALIQHYEKV
ncbi:MAG: NAD(P)H-dependent oxidoreductase subunit E [Theionarchaea archaeon]|nr:NAD(P)H-dependent oxidoreductase subunit E [Theionarchaea archaeon]